MSIAGRAKVWERTHNGCAFSLRQGETMGHLINNPNQTHRNNDELSGFKQRRDTRSASLPYPASSSGANTSSRQISIPIAQSVRFARGNVCRALGVSI